MIAPDAIARSREARWKVLHHLPASRLLCFVAVLAVTAVPVLQAQATLDSSVIAMFPKDVSEFGYANLGQAREFGWYAQLQAQLVPVSLANFEQFLEAAQLQEESPIEQVAWGLLSPRSANLGDGYNSVPTAGGGQIVAVAKGQFDPDAIESFLSSHNAPNIKAGDLVLYSAETGSGALDVYFTVIDSSTIAFGPLAALKRVLAVRSGAEDNIFENEEMITMIDQANGGALFWGVLDSAGAGATFQRLVPEASAFPEARGAIAKMHELMVTVTASSNLQVDVQAGSGSAANAMLLSQLLQAGLMYQRYQSNQNNPDLAQILDGARISANGDNLELTLNLTDDQTLGLIEHDTFSSLK